MIGDAIKVTTDTDQEEVARIVATYNLLAVNNALPVKSVKELIDYLMNGKMPRLA